MILQQNNRLLKPNLDTKLSVNNCQLISHIPPVELIFNHILSLQGKWRVPVNLISLFQGEWSLHSSDPGAFGISVLPHIPPKDKVSYLSPRAESVQYRCLYFLLAASTIAGCVRRPATMLRSCYLESHGTALTRKWTSGSVVLLCRS